MSKETLDFLANLGTEYGLLRPIFANRERYCRDVHGVELNYAASYWTPPLPPRMAFDLERRQIEDRLQLPALVSITDHDDIEAPLQLRSAFRASHIPISVEWTVPYHRSIFHLGIHNLPPADAQSWMSAMAAYTARPDENLLREILSACAAIPEVLIVLNHPFWLEEGVEKIAHRPALDRLVLECAAWFHAFELNGTRAWSENAAVMELAQIHSRPIVSGGDRHACEPAACLNLTNARSFSEFASEVRGGHSSVLFLPHYRQPMAFRVLEASCEILRAYPEFPGRERWIDRVDAPHQIIVLGGATERRNLLAAQREKDACCQSGAGNLLGRSSAGELISGTAKAAHGTESAAGHSEHQRAARALR